jgi:hypothetical protein
MSGREEVVLVNHPDADALEQAIASDADWLWLLADGAQPASDALERLLDAVEPAGEPRAALVAGLVNDGSGRVIGDALPGFLQNDDDAVLRLVAQRLLPLRSATFDHCLIRRTCFVHHGVPDTEALGRHAPVAWTARVLRDAPGYFTPLSIARLAGPPRSEPPPRWPAATMNTLRMTRTGGWTRGESARALARLLTARASDAGSVRR